MVLKEPQEVLRAAPRLRVELKAELARVAKVQVVPQEVEPARSQTHYPSFLPSGGMTALSLIHI